MRMYACTLPLHARDSNRNQIENKSGQSKSEIGSLT